MAPSTGFEPVIAGVTGQHLHQADPLGVELERPVGLEPTWPTWKDGDQPMNQGRIKLERVRRLELPTSSLARKCSTN